MQNKKVILAVANQAGKGKTQTLGDLRTYLKIIYPYHVELKLTPPGYSGSGDFSCVLQIRDLIVGIESKGDPNSQLEARLKDLVVNWKATVIFCATRTSGGTVEDVHKIERAYGFETIWSATYEGVNSQRQMNQTKAKHIHDLMQTLGHLP